jgi:hypothetical protein
VLKASIISEENKSPIGTKEQPNQEEGFQEVPRRKRHSTDETANIVKKDSVQTKTSTAVKTTSKRSPPEIFCRPLRATEMDTDSSSTEALPGEETGPGKIGRPPPIFLAYATNRIQLQKQLKSVVKENFEFRSTTN